MILPTKLYHYSEKKIGDLRPDFYERHKMIILEDCSMKPHGFWISVEDYADDINWFDWCKSQSFRISHLQYRYSVLLAPDVNILLLNTANLIDHFSNIYVRADVNKSMQMINWKLVKDQYDGIIIAPYQWSRRFCPYITWYYVWDCASGCIWNLDKVKLSLESFTDVTTLLDKEELEVPVLEEKVKDLLPGESGLLA